jgi:hypothetical protein
MLVSLTVFESIKACLFLKKNHQDVIYKCQEDNSNYHHCCLLPLKLSSFYILEVSILCPTARTDPKIEKKAMKFQWHNKEMICKAWKH